MKLHFPRRRLALIAAFAVLPLPAAAFPVSGLAASAAASAFVRVNQVGYPTTAPKRAYLMASTIEPRATFTVRDSAGASVFTGRVGARLGRWSLAYPDVYAIDFDGLRTAGSYTIQVQGPVPAASPAFRVDPPDRLYLQAMQNALSFYQNERDGPDFIPSALRTAPGHLNDQHAMTYLTPKVDANGFFKGDLQPLGVRIDASGAWWDAGDYPKFVETTSYTVAMLLSGVRDFPGQLGSAAGPSNMTAEGKFGTDWLLRMWDDRSRTLYYQVGIGEGNANTVGDHDIWRLPQADDTYGGTDPKYRYIRNRPVFRAAPPGSPVSPNIAGRDAATFAICFQVFRHSDPAFANRCLTAAEHIYALADTSPKGNLLTVVPYDFYPEVEWRDDLELGASELALALRSAGSAHLPGGLPETDARYYLRQAAHWAHAYITGPNDATDTLNLYDVSGFAHYQLVKAMAAVGTPTGLEVTRAALIGDLKKQLDKALGQGSTDPFQFGFPWNVWDTTSHGAGLSVMASEYDELTGTTAYAEWSVRWLSNILGANAWGVSLIVGDGTTFPQCMQHQVANLAGSLDGSPPILAGAAVEGPNGITATGTVPGMRLCPANGVDVYAPFDGHHGAKFEDNVQNYPNVEPAIDLTATSPLAFARQSLGRY